MGILRDILLLGAVVLLVWGAVTFAVGDPTFLDKVGDGPATSIAAGLGAFWDGIKDLGGNAWTEATGDTPARETDKQPSRGTDSKKAQAKEPQGETRASDRRPEPLKLQAEEKAAARVSMLQRAAAFLEPEATLGREDELQLKSDPPRKAEASPAPKGRTSSETKASATASKAKPVTASSAAPAAARLAAKEKTRTDERISEKEKAALEALIAAPAARKP